MEGADVSTELRHSFFIAKTFFSVVHSPLRSYVTGQPTKHQKEASTTTTTTTTTICCLCCQWHNNECLNNNGGRISRGRDNNILFLFFLFKSQEGGTLNSANEL